MGVALMNMHVILITSAFSMLFPLCHQQQHAISFAHVLFRSSGSMSNYAEFIGFEKGCKAARKWNLCTLFLVDPLHMHEAHGSCFK